MRRRKPKIVEEDLAGVVIDYLEDLGWEVFQEVGHGVGVADIVARSGKLIWVVEAKTSLSLQVMAQAARWRWHTHYVSVAVPRGKRRDSSYGFASRILSDYGIGLLEVDCQSRYVQPTLVPSLMRKAASDRLAAGLVEEQKYYAKAGSKSGKHYTKWSGTRDRLVAYVFAHPGCTLKEALSNIEHHYHSPSSARASMAQLILTSAIPSIRSEHVVPKSKVGKTQVPDNLKVRGLKGELRLFPVVYDCGPKDVPDGAKPVGFWQKFETPSLYKGFGRNLLHLGRYLRAASTCGSLGSGIAVCPICGAALPYEQRLTQDGKWVFPTTLLHLFSSHTVAPPLPEFLIDSATWYESVRAKKNALQSYT